MTVVARAKKRSPILGAASSMIGEASTSLVSVASEFNHTFEVDVDLVRPDPDQPRRQIDSDALTALAATLRTEGQLQPILLRPDPHADGRWLIVAGERRWRAATMNGWKKLLAIAHNGDPEVASLLENLQRVDLTPLEEARGVNRLLTEKGWTQEQAARALGKPKSDISGTLRILTLPEGFLTEVLTSEHPPSKNVLVELARISNPAALAKLVALALEGNLTVKALRATRSTAEADPRDPTESRNDTAKTFARSTWSVVTKAERLVSTLAAQGKVISDKEVQALRSLRDAIDLALDSQKMPG
jgi:ParB family chromosome partitioning protein